MTAPHDGVEVLNPATEEILAFYPHTTSSELDEIMSRGYNAFDRWRRTDVDERIAALGRLSAELQAQKPALAAQIVTEMGKPIRQAEAEIDKCVATCAYYAEHLRAMLAPRAVDVAPDSAAVHIRPLGVILAILPWNYPWWQVIRAMLPAILVGNSVVLKHADSVTGCAYAIEDAFLKTFGDHVLSTVVLPGQRVREAIDHPRIAAVAFTGSERVGALVATAAGAVLKKCVLELGGSDPFIVLEDADIEKAAAAAVRSRFLNNGQSCIAAKRIIAHNAVSAHLIEAMRSHVTALQVGDPMDPATDVGPLARLDLRDTLHEQRAHAQLEGAAVVASQAAPSGAGAWFDPTLMELAPGRQSVLLRNETFGPLGAITTVDSTDHAILVANDSQYGLSSSVWTSDIERAQTMAEHLEAGSVFINTISASDPRLPVGGVKASGYGRELADYGITEFANIQAVRVGTFPTR